MAPGLKETGLDQAIKTPEQVGEISKRKFEALPPAQKKEVVARIQADPNWKIALDEVRKVAGAFWDGWEKGVNDAVKGGSHVLKATGTWIGETTAEAIVGKEGGLTDKLVKDTQGIRDGLNVVGPVLGETTAKIISTGEGAEVWNNTKDYWKGVGNDISSMSSEGRAHAAGTGMAFVATTVVGAKGLDKLSKASALPAEYSVGSGVVGSTVNKVVSGVGQIGMELAVGSNQRKMKLGENLAFRKQRGAVDLFASSADVPKEGFKHIFERLNILKKQMGTSKVANDAIDKAIEAARFENNTKGLEQLIDAFGRNKKTADLAKELNKALDIIKARKPSEHVVASISKEGAPVVQEITENEALIGIGHRGRIDKLSELFANGKPDIKTFVVEAKDRILEAKAFLENAKTHHGWDNNDVTVATRKFLSELREATQSHISEARVPEFNTTEEALVYLKTL